MFHEMSDKRREIIDSLNILFAVFKSISMTKNRKISFKHDTNVGFDD